MARQDGQFLVEDFYLNTGGLNTADSPFVVGKDCATGGQNFDYVKRGGIQKRPGHLKLNSTADTDTRGLGLHLWNKASATRKVIRAAGRHIQNFDYNAYTFTNLTEDTTAVNSTFLALSSTVPTVSSMFNTADAGNLWLAGGGLTSLYGVCSTTKVTKNGVDAPTVSAFTGPAAGTGGTLATGSYTYTLVYRKTSTQALSNAMVSTSEVATSVTLGQKVTLAWTLTNSDVTKYDQVYVYRSSAGGVAGFTAGSLIAQVAIGTATYLDDGTNVATSQNVPRANNVVLDNSTLPTGAYGSVTTFKRRLVTASGSSLYISDINKDESWPTTNRFTIPSGGDITGLAVISISSSYGFGIDELLCIFKQSELWIISGDSYVDWVLKFVDTTGCAGQSLITTANGYLAWVNFRGIFLWNGTGKPIYASQTIEDKFGIGGDIDKSKLYLGFGVFAQSRNEIQWYLSSSTYGEQNLVLKLDLRLTLGGQSSTLTSPVLSAVFTPDVPAFPVYAALTFLDSGTATEEQIYLGDTSGFIYSGYKGAADGAAAVYFQYLTPYLNFNSPNNAKKYHKVVVWVLDAGPFDLALDYWADYRFEVADQSSLSLPASASLVTQGAKWGAFTWGAANWGGSANKIKPLTFNLNSSRNNGEGDALRIQLSQSGTTQSVTIYGFSVYYTELPLRK